jgi:hypothetical protein
MIKPSMEEIRASRKLLTIYRVDSKGNLWRQHRLHDLWFIDEYAWSQEGPVFRLWWYGDHSNVGDWYIINGDWTARELARDCEEGMLCLITERKFSMRDYVQFSCQQFSILMGYEFDVDWDYDEMQEQADLYKTKVTIRKYL